MTDAMDPKPYTDQDAWQEVMESLIDTFDHDTDTYTQLVEILTGSDVAHHTAEEQLLNIKRTLVLRNRERMALIDRAQISAAMVDLTDDPQD